jgi:rhodanese-related sulfurtransferase
MGSELVTQRNNIDASTLRDMLERGERVTVVDVRMREAYTERSIPESVNFDAYEALHADDERAMEGLEPPEGASGHRVQPRALRRGRRRAVAAARLRGVLLGGRVGSLEGPLTCPGITCSDPYGSPG